MYKILIHSQKHGEMWLVKETQAEVDAFIEHCRITEHYGKNAYTEIITPAYEEIIPAHTLENGFVVEEQVIKHEAITQDHEAEYSLEIVPYKAPIEDISPRQIRLALLSLGVTESDVDSAISRLPELEKNQAMIAWKFSTSFVRELPIIDQLGTSLGLSSDQLDQLWILAKSL